MKDPPIHPAAGLFPMLEGSAWTEFLEDIRANGQQEAIVLWRGQVLDGRNRLRACNELGLVPKTRELPDDTDPVAFVMSANLHRRHLSESQRAMVGARVKVLFEEEAKERMRLGGMTAGRGRPQGVANLPHPIDDSGKSRDKAAAIANVSPRSIESASKVIAPGNEDLARMVDAGEVSVSAAAAVANLPAPDREEVVARGPDAVQQKAKEVREGLPPLPEEDPVKKRREKMGQRWNDLLHELYLTINGMRDDGGIQKVAESWTVAGRKKTAAELERMTTTIAGWISHLKGGA